MLIRSNIKGKTLMMVGIQLIALRSLLQWLADSTHTSTSFIVFALAVVLGVGIGLSLLGMWIDRHRDGNAACGRS